MSEDESGCMTEGRNAWKMSLVLSLELELDRTYPRVLHLASAPHLHPATGDNKAMSCKLLAPLPLGSARSVSSWDSITPQMAGDAQAPLQWHYSSTFQLPRGRK